MKYEIKNRWTGAVIFTAEIDCAGDESDAIKLGLAVRLAVNAGADLTDAKLTGANLTGANLTGANLMDTNLTRASLAGANLADTNFTDANLAGAHLARAVGADLAIARTRILPEGDIIGWKKLRDGMIAKLLIGADVARSHAFGRKCRAASAVCLEITRDGAPVEVGYARHQGDFEYRVGATIEPDAFDENWQDECASGIHFFITRAEAEAA